MGQTRRIGEARRRRQQGLTLSDLKACAREAASSLSLEPPPPRAPAAGLQAFAHGADRHPGGIGVHGQHQRVTCVCTG
jgi:hypothetical protein